ncbi:MAG TPA: hypothetical protein VEJ86_10490, partial [Candidatus Binataceae bacterium]|nr:hypothetical protein [Candidatus Binataceae bacterium]
GGPCVNAARLANQARRDDVTGHRAAANDVWRMSQWAQGACGGGGYGYGAYSAPYAGQYGYSGLSGLAPLLHQFIP